MNKGRRGKVGERVLLKTENGLSEVKTTEGWDTI